MAEGCCDYIAEMCCAKYKVIVFTRDLVVARFFNYDISSISICKNKKFTKIPTRNNATKNPQEKISCGYFF